jgi:hypothetical protein
LKDRVNTYSGHHQKSRSHGVEELRSRRTENRELTATLILAPQARKVAVGSSTARLPNSSTPKFNERSGNVYENKGRCQKVKKSSSQVPPHPARYSRHLLPNRRGPLMMFVFSIQKSWERS